jgi:alanine racemase
MPFKEEPQYRSWVEVDLDNFTGNLQEVRRLVGAQVKILQVVKADAYGHGAIEISHTAVKNGASCLGVANADEGVQLRVGGITAPIIILSPSPISEISEIIKYNLTPSVSDISFARELQTKYEKSCIKAPIHVEIDTGMGRCGTMNHDGIDMIMEIIDFPNVYIEGIFTHLSQSEILAPQNENQWRLFQELLADMEKHNIYIPVRHMANSGAILNFPAFHLDMVRPGLMTYGIYPSTETMTKARLAPVMSFKTRVLLIKDFPSGYGIGYGSTFITERPTKIATIPVGYGDGYGFILSNQGEALIRGKRSPVVGRISMDMCTLNVSHIPDCQVGDEVVMLGRQGAAEITADAIAAKAGTISYEIICALGKRAPRIFLQKGKKDDVVPRLRRIFIPDEEKSISRIDNIIRHCFHARAHNEELGDAIYYTMFETLFGKEDRQLELRSHFKYDIYLEEFSAGEITGDPSCKNHFKVTTRVEYHKILKNKTFLVGCAENDEQLAAFLEDANCEYRWLLNSSGYLQANRDFLIKRVRIDDEDVPLIKTESTARGYEVWYGRDDLAGKINREVKVEIEVVTKKSKKSRDFSVYLIYPIRGLEISFHYGGTNLSNVREVAFFAGKHPSPSLLREKDKISLSICDDEWVFPTSGMTFIWDY